MWAFLDTILFHFFVLVNTVATFSGMRFFSCGTGFSLKLSLFALLLKRLQLGSKIDLSTNGLILGFFVGKWLLSLTSYLYGLKSARDAQLLFYFDDINFFRCLG